MEYQNEQVPGNDPTMHEYVIRATVRVVRHSAQQGMSGGQSEFSAIVLVPRIGTTTDRFFSAWLPDTSEEHSEIVITLGHPVFGTSRAAVLRSGKFYPYPHIFIMSKGVEDILAHCEDMVLDVKILACAEDSQGDQAVDTDKDIDAAKFEIDLDNHSDAL